MMIELAPGLGERPDFDDDWISMDYSDSDVFDDDWIAIDKRLG